jgi:hypothetical protein
MSMTTSIIIFALFIIITAPSFGLELFEQLQMPRGDVVDKPISPWERFKEMLEYRNHLIFFI